MVEPFTDIDPGLLGERLEAVRGVTGADVEILVAGKYVPLGELGALEQAGVDLIGENRSDDLIAKRERWGDRFAWDFIGNLQSRKVKDVVGIVRLIHSVASDSVLDQLAKHAPKGTEVLVQVNVAGEDAKGGVEPKDLTDFIDRCPVDVVGLSTMPPFASDPEASRPYFASLAELAGSHGLARLSMGTSQDWRVAVEEGATTIRLGSTLFD